MWYGRRSIACQARACASSKRSELPDCTASRKTERRLRGEPAACVFFTFHSPQSAQPVGGSLGMAGGSCSSLGAQT